MAGSVPNVQLLNDVNKLDVSVFFSSVMRRG
jgi:hypothetical protein